MLADLRDRHLELLEDGQQPLHVAELPAQSLDRPRDLPGVERVVDLPVPGQAVPEPGRRRSSGSLVIRPSRTSGRLAAASTNRVVVSSRKGATNPATTMGRTYSLPRGVR